MGPDGLIEERAESHLIAISVIDIHIPVGLVELVDHDQPSHHIVGFVLQQVAVPDITRARRRIEGPGVDLFVKVICSKW